MLSNSSNFKNVIFHVNSNYLHYVTISQYLNENI